MSVLIKNMEMPKNCSECKLLCNENFIMWCCLTDREDVFLDATPDWCPLVALPEKHGDLIDRQTLKDAVLKWMPPDPCGKEEKEFPYETDICVSMMMEIEEQDAVIEAEGEG